MVEHLNTIWKAVNAASTVSELARQSQTYHFPVAGPVTLYLRAEQAEVRLTRWTKTEIEVMAQLQAAFGWRLATDQDEAGVYIVARRRALLGGLSRVVFSIFAPHDTYFLLKLDESRVLLDQVNGALHIPPAAKETYLKIESPS